MPIKCSKRERDAGTRNMNAQLSPVMPNISLLPVRFNVWQAQQELQTCQGWNLLPLRTQGCSPHRECDDIWMRYRSGAIRTDGSFDCTWYDVADELPSIQLLCEGIFALYEGKEMGGVLITRIPAGKQVYPHVDQGWHALHYEKFAIQLAGNAEQSFCFEDACLSPLPGELYQFNNQACHWVTNPSEEDRITLICCIRRAH